MGAVNGKEEKLNAIPPPASVYAIRNILTGPNDDVQANTLDRSLKGFLRQSNMSGLEYRLRLAGIYTLDDLIMSDETMLSQHGFTRLMARKLFQALVRFVDQLESQDNQRRIRRSTLLRSSDNYGKRNKRRDPSSHRDPSKRVNNAASRKISVSPLPNYKPKVISISPADIIDGSQRSPISNATIRSDEMSGADEGSPLEQIVEQNIEDDIPAEREVSPEYILPVSSPINETQEDIQLLSQRILQETPTNIDHHLSVPFGLDCINRDQLTSSFLNDRLDRSLSCPCLLVLEDTAPLVTEEDPNELHKIISALASHEARDVEELLILLYSLLDVIKFACFMNIEDMFSVVCNVLYRHLNNGMVAEISCRIIKYLTVNLNHNSCSNQENLEKVVRVVLDVIKYHPFNKRCQLNCCLVINNVFRSGQYKSNIEIDNILSVLSCTLENYQKDEPMILGVLTAVVAALATASNDLTTISQQLQMSLEQLCILMDMMIDNIQILQYTLSFFTLSLINVAPLVDDNVMKSIIKLVILTLNTHKQRSDVVVYCCKTVSQIAPHKLIEDNGVSKELTDCLLNVISLHPKSSGVQTWSSYALYQLASYNNTLIPYVKTSGCLEGRKHSLPHLNEEARSYVEQLAALATL